MRQLVALRGQTYIDEKGNDMNTIRAFFEYMAIPIGLLLGILLAEAANSEELGVIRVETPDTCRVLVDNGYTYVSTRYRDCLQVYENLSDTYNTSHVIIDVQHDNTDVTNHGKLDDNNTTN